jgi:uncharacterized DUF497 family protein
VIFEWDAKKAAANIRKHGVPFTVAASVFLDPLAWTFPDTHHSRGELRFITVGGAADGSVLVVSHAELDDDRIRVISARPASSRERKSYEEG